MDSATKDPQDTNSPTPAPNRAVPFMAAFNAIEGFLRDELNAKKSDSFKSVSYTHLRAHETN